MSAAIGATMPAPGASLSAPPPGAAFGAAIGATADPAAADRPRLGLAVAAKGPFDPVPFLQALREEPAFGGPGIEIHIAHDDGWPAGLAPPLPNIRLHACAPGSPVSVLWGVALARAATDHVAVLDIQVPPAPGWLRRAEAEIAAGTPLFFGPVVPGWAMRDRRLLGYLIEYAQFQAPVPPDLGEVPGNNLVGLRRLLLEPGAEGAPQPFFKTFALWRLAREAGLAPRCLDDMAVAYRKGFAPRPYLAARIGQGRSFAARRHANPGQPPQLLCIAFTPLLPLLRVQRILHATRRDAVLRRATRRHLPFLLLAEAAWSFGEFLGYLAGPAREEA